MCEARGHPIHRIGLLTIVDLGEGRRLPRMAGEGAWADAGITGGEGPQWVRLRAFNVRHSRTLGVSQNPSIFGLKSLLQIS